MKKGLFYLSLFFIFSSFSFKLQAQPGSRKNDVHTAVFTLIGLKTEENPDGMVNFSLLFNDMLDSNSIHENTILINEKSLPSSAEFKFSKNRRNVKFQLNRNDFIQNNSKKSFSILLVKIKSYDGRTINPIQIPDIEINSFVKYNRREKTWKKFSL